MTVTTGALPSGVFTAGNEIVGNQGGATKRLTLASTGLSDVEQSALWTPTLYGATTAGVMTYSVQTGVYTKVGEICTLNFNLGWTNLTGTGGARIGGLPFLAKSFSGNHRFAVTISYYNSLTLPTGIKLAGYLQDNTNYINLLNFNETTANDLTDLQTELTTAGELYGSITYIV